MSGMVTAGSTVTEKPVKSRRAIPMTVNGSGLQGLEPHVVFHDESPRDWSEAELGEEVSPDRQHGLVKCLAVHPHVADPAKAPRNHRGKHGLLPLDRHQRRI